MSDLDAGVSDPDVQLRRHFGSAPAVDVEHLAVGLETRGRRRRNLSWVAVGAGMLAALLAVPAFLDLSGTDADTVPVVAGSTPDAGQSQVEDSLADPPTVRIGSVGDPVGDRVEITAGLIYLEVDADRGISSEHTAAKAGWIELVLRNSDDGGYHELAVEDGPSVRLTVREPGETARAVVWLDPGRYTLYDPTPGYREAGAELVLYAEGPVDAAQD